ncbi:hypothetical protein A3A79_03650 [Candidatus Gottesmanbacteria bacterium RIFCSPLOWO2_01_FULL_43_11b]|uniref:HTH cro/C1-type domain-containing protein n=1 Tax=Candidatus Gottesmanbacteria bacterium RIFCSPLOWO2_01_FULL_43_11b TaxID=1798392 RepID=A0A1F6AIX6_9BACT|nr:MAG: hypothetical protein A3A79_03650 [Candidatus Gottesmanbacteria bacterium RIFCSPLOWO2_01_FULL_43_11b]
MNWATHKKQLLKDSAFRAALRDSALEYRIAREVITKRIKHKLTQKQLAQRLKTRQSVISRLENAKTVPSLSFLKRLAKVFGTKVSISLSPLP